MKRFFLNIDTFNKNISLTANGMSNQITKKAQSFQKSINIKNKNKKSFKPYHSFLYIILIVIYSHNPCSSSKVQTRLTEHNCLDGSKSKSTPCTNIALSKNMDGVVVLKNVEKEEGEVYSLTQGVESCPNFIESETEKYPILTARQHRKMKEKKTRKVHVDEINTNLKYGKDVLNTILEQLTYNFDYDDKSFNILQNEKKEDSDWSRHGKKQTFFKDLRFRLLSFASTTSSSTAIAGLTIDPTIASASMAAAHLEASHAQKNIKNDGNDIQETRSPSSMFSSSSSYVKERDQLPNSDATKSRYPGGKIVGTIHVEKEESYSIPAENSEDFHHQMELIAGSQLLSASLGLLSSSIGLLADSVRIIGDTTAGVAGSSVKLAGTAVKSVSSSLYMASDLVEGTDKEKNFNEMDPNLSTPKRQKKRRPLTSAKLGIDLGLENQRDGDHDISYEAGNGFLNNSRTVAGKTVRYVSFKGRNCIVMF